MFNYFKATELDLPPRKKETRLIKHSRNKPVHTLTFQQLTDAGCLISVTVGVKDSFKVEYQGADNERTLLKLNKSGGSCTEELFGRLVHIDTWYKPSLIEAVVASYISKRGYMISGDSATANWRVTA